MTRRGPSRFSLLDGSQVDHGLWWTHVGIDTANKEIDMGDNDGSIGPGFFFKTAIDNFARGAGLTPRSGDTKYDQAAVIITGLQQFCAGMRDAYGSKAG